MRLLPRLKQGNLAQGDSMKKRLHYLVVLILCIFMIAGCDMFSVMFDLFKELLPIAIKYAPYALMFLEAPGESQDRDLALTSETDRSPIDKALPLPHVLEKFLANGTGKEMHIVAIHLKSKDTEAEIQKWAKGQTKFRVLYVATFCNLSDGVHYRQIQTVLLNYPQITFVATGPLEHLSSISSDQRVALLGDIAK